MSRRQLLSFAVMAVLLSSCAKVQEGGAAAPDMPISYQVVSTTKAASAYPENRSFVSWAWYLPDGMEWAQNSARAQLYIPGETVSFDGSYWTTSTPYYWPKSGSLTFMSLSPSGLVGVSCSPERGIELENYSVTANPAVDLMVADIAADRSANEVLSIFRHKLAKVVGFTLKTDKDYGDATVVGGKEFILERISFGGVCTVGSYVSGNSTGSGPEEGWSGLSGRESQTWYEGDVSVTAAGMALEEDLFVLPQTFGPEAVLTVEYTIRTCIAEGEYHEEHVTESVRLSELHSSWEMNRQISYSITIGLDVMEWEASSEKWQDRDAPDITV